MLSTPRDTKSLESALLRAADRKNQYYTLLYTEMAERKRAEEHLRRSNLLLQALSQAQLQYLAGAQLTLIFRNLLHALLNATDAEQGLLRECCPAEENSSHTCLAVIEGQAQGWEPAHLAAVAEQVVLTRQQVLLNPVSGRQALTLSPPSDTYLFGLPIVTGAALFVESGVDDALVGSDMVGVVVIAGRTMNYSNTLLELLQPLLSTCAQLVIAHRTDQRRRTAEIALAEERASLAQRVAERTAELARAARAKDEFLATMNHELRTPLNAVLLYAESLQSPLRGPLNERQLRAVAGIRESGHHLLTLINDILDVAKMDADKLNLDIAPCAVESVCQSSIRLVMEMAQRKRLQLHYHLDSNVTLMDVDERRLKQMLVNLLSNAIKFTPAEGSVELEISGDLGNNTVHFAVCDTGIGIAPKDMEKLFQPFSQVDGGHARHHGGTGLGLYLVYRMTELHGGSVAVTSTVNQGSRFTISLPWHQRSRSAPLNVPLIPPVTMGSHADITDAHLERSVHEQPLALRPKYPPVLLLAEDNVTNINVLSEFLQEWHCRIVIARTGIEAVQEAKVNRPDLILMDIQMPEMNGIDAIRLIRAESELRHIPIIALTALAMPGDRERCLAAGANDYISKPIQLERLSKVLQGWLRYENGDGTRTELVKQHTPALFIAALDASAKSKE
jgi:signal transduction histidine kinase/CheY-like chemotaxis protein